MTTGGQSEVEQWFPLSDEDHAAQLADVFRLIAPFRDESDYFIDLGAGAGRMALPVAQTGRRVLAVDRDERALGHCESALITRRCADLFDEKAPLTIGGERAAGAWCLGHTFLTLHEPEKMLGLMGRVRDALAPGGFLVIDNFCEAVWRDVAEGRWQTGVSEDGQWQMIWRDDDNVVALRRGTAVNAEKWDIEPDDLLMRLWSMGELRLLAAGAGFSAPEVSAGGALLIFRTHR